MVQLLNKIAINIPSITSVKKWDSRCKVSSKCFSKVFSIPMTTDESIF